MSDDTQQPEPATSQEPDPLDEYKAGKRRKRRMILVILAVVVGLAALTYPVYYLFFRLDHLISQVKECSFSAFSTTPEGPCKAPLKKLVGYLPEKCPRVLAEIKAEPNLDKKNGLLLALLTARVKQSPGGIHTRASIRGDRCLESAILHVAGSVTAKTPDLDRKTIIGIRRYNMHLLAHRATWGIRMRILNRLPVSALQRKFGQLVLDTDAALDSSNASLRKTALALVTKHLIPAMAKVYRAGIEQPGRREPGSTYPKPFPDGLARHIAQRVSWDSPLGKEILNTFLTRVRFEEKRFSAAVSWHHTLFGYHTREASREKQRAFLARAAVHRRACYNCFYALLTSIRAPNSSAPAKLHRWLSEDIKRATLDEFGSDLLSLSRVLALYPNGRLLLRLIHLNGLKIRYGLKAALAALIKADPRAADEVARGFQIALLAYRRPGYITTSEGLRGFKRYRWLPWLNRYFEINIAKYGSYPTPAAPPDWSKWGAKHVSPAVRAAFAKDPKAMAANLRSANPNVRFLAPLALLEKPFPDRLSLLRPGLKDKLASVRAMTAFVLGHQVKKKADVNELAPLLRQLRKDEDWTVRLVAFRRLAAQKQQKLLAPFVNDTAPLTTSSFRKLTEKWSTAQLWEWLARTDHGAGHVLYQLMQRSHKKPKEFEALWDKLSALVKRGDAWTRLRVLTWFQFKTFDKIDWTPLFTDPSVAVRYQACFSLRRYGKKPSYPKYAPALVRLLDDKSFGVKIQAISALNKCKHRPALPRLRKLAKHPVCFVRRAAQNAIGEILGKAPRLPECQGPAAWKY